MRIIAGEFGGRRLLAPDSEVTRPVTDRVKQSMFDILAPLLPDARVYDCFAGTGSMGLESLSRGAYHAAFFESDRSAAARLRRNIETLKVQARSRVVTQDLFRWFETEPPPPAEQRAGVIFLDPPYRFVRDRPVEVKRLATWMAERHLAPGGVIVFRHDAADRLQIAGLAAVDERTYGGMMIEFLKAAPSE
jgi:16S rRNA (guanine966-N2)-methyltransferase